MPRHRMPREIAELKGSVRANPHRYKNKPITSGLPLGDAPAHLSEATVKAWHDLEKNSYPGVLQGSDRFILELTAGLLAEFRSHPVAFTAGKYRNLISCLGRIGLTPVERQSLGVQLPGINPFDQF
jgi:hypothetical protein